MAKRAAGDGTFHFDKSRKLWVGRASFGYDANGKRVRRVVYGSTQREVREKHAALKAQHAGGVLPASGREATVAQFLRYWLETVHKPAVRPNTYRRDESAVRVHLIPALGRHRLSQLRTQHVREMLRQKHEGELSARSVQHMRAVLRSALNHALSDALVSQNVAKEGIRLPEVRRREIPALEPDMAAKIIAAVRDDRLGPIITVALAVGLRQGEAIGLRWQDVDLHSGTLHVEQAIQRVDGVLVASELKTKNSRRVIALPRFAIPVLEGHRVRRAEERAAAGGVLDESDLIFVGRRGQPLEGPHVTRHFQGILAATCCVCGSKRTEGHDGHDFEPIPKMRFHDLRHGAVSLLLAQGVPITTISTILGHASARTTDEVYKHLTESLKRDAADAMDRAFTATS